MVGLYVRQGLQSALLGGIFGWRRFVPVCAGQRGQRRRWTWGFAVEIRVFNGRELAHEHVLGEERVLAGAARRRSCGGGKAAWLRVWCCCSDDGNG